jgi:hypothetical protein
MKKTLQWKISSETHFKKSEHVSRENETKRFETLRKSERSSDRDNGDLFERPSLGFPSYIA